jgi:hypothetical protein
MLQKMSLRSLVGVGEMVAVTGSGADFQNDKICHSGRNPIRKPE